MANTEDVLGPQGTLDALISDTLTELEDDRAITLSNQYGLTHTNNLKRVSLPNATLGNNFYFHDMLGLETVELKTATTRAFNNNGSSFLNLPKLTHLILRQQTSAGTNSYDPLTGDTRIAKGYGAVYVPSSAVATFKANAKWGKYRIEPLESYPISLDTISDSWEQIVQACGDGTYASKYQIGDVKTLPVAGSDVYMTLVAMDADVLDSDGHTTVPTTWVSLPFAVSEATMNTTSVNGKGWADMGLRSMMTNYYLPSIGNEAVRSAIKEVRKTYVNQATYNGAVTTESCADKLWVPSYRETLSDETTFTYLEAEGPMYGLASLGFGDSASYWTRTRQGYTGGFMAVTSSGSYNSVSMTSKSSVVIGYCI